MQRNVIISVIGFGNVGQCIVNQLLDEREYDFLINAIDTGDDLEGSFLDLAHAARVNKNHSLFFNDHLLWPQSEIIFHCAGGSVPDGQSRLSVASENKVLTKSIFKNLNMDKEPYIIVITNPVDIISYHTWKASNLPPSKVIGTGTLLDTARLEYYLSKELSNNPEILTATVLGEHGESMVPLLSGATIGDRRLDALLESNVLERCFTLTKEAASTIKRTQGATRYGVAHCAVRIMKAILKPKDEILTVSVLLTQSFQGMFECDELFMSLPARFTSEGVYPVELLKFNSLELKELKKSAAVIQDHLNS